MRTRRLGGFAVLITAVLLVSGTATASAAGGGNDEQCVPSGSHPNAIVLLHGLAANKNEDINALQDRLTERGYCTFSLTYGAYPAFPAIGGLVSLDSSADQIAAFTTQVAAVTGSKVDLVGHSEGAFEALYVAKFRPAATAVLGRVAAIAPPTHNLDPSTAVTVGSALGHLPKELLTTVLGLVGCQACTGLSAAQARLATGPIAQPGIAYTITTSTHDEIATPPAASFVHEPGVRNEYVQDTCPQDPVGHLGEPYDDNVKQLVENALDPAHAKPPNPCAVGLPI